MSLRFSWILVIKVELIRLSVDIKVRNVNPVILDLLGIKTEIVDGKPDQTFLVDINLERIQSCQQDVDPQVELTSAYEVGVGDVSLHQDSLVTTGLGNLVRMVDHVYP